VVSKISFLKLNHQLQTGIVTHITLFSCSVTVGKQCSGAFVLQHHSVRALCQAVDGLVLATPSQAPSPLDYAAAAARAESPPTLSSGQEQMLMLHSSDPKSGFYNQPLTLGLFGSVDIERLRECIDVG
jgi:hypothetical protein